MNNNSNNRLLRVALVCTSMNQLGGKNRHLKNLYKYLDRDIFKIFIICCSKVKDELIDFMIREGVPEEDLILLSRFKKWMIVPFILDLRRFFIDNKISIVHTFDIQSDIIGAFAARLAGIKYIFSFFESKAIVENISFIKQLVYKLFNLPVRRWFAKNVVVSEGLKKELIFGKFRPPESIEVIHLGFKVPDKYKGYKWSFKRLKERRPLIGTISRFSKEKGIERFIAAIPFVLKEIPDAQFIIAGKGPELRNLWLQVQQLGLISKVIFKEWVDDVFPILETIDIFVMPSVREGCPIALLEALAFCRPVVASRIEGVIDIIEHGKDGLLVDTTNPEAFSKSIIFLCKNPEKAILLGENGCQKIDTQFTIEREISQIKQLYLNVVKQNLNN